jgi:hypothetical protein
MEYKTTRRLFRGTYQYKIVLTCVGSQWFRNGDITKTFEELKKINVGQEKKFRSTAIKSQEDLDYAFSLATALSNFTDYDVRVESPWISIYSNSKKHVDALVKLDPSKVKYVSQPDPNASLATGTIIMPKMDFDYRITLGKTTQPNPSFVQWAETSKKCKLTKSCIRDLGKPRSWGGTHFYITGDNNLLLAKMHLGGSIAKIERIVKS